MKRLRSMLLVLSSIVVLLTIPTPAQAQVGIWCPAGTGAIQFTNDVTGGASGNMPDVFSFNMQGPSLTWKTTKAYQMVDVFVGDGNVGWRVQGQLQADGGYIYTADRTLGHALFCLKPDPTGGRLLTSSTTIKPVPAATTPAPSKTGS